jgi:taurine dioxygenase
MSLRVRPPAGPVGLRRPERRDYGRFRVRPVGVSVGAVIEGVDLRRPCDNDLQEALAEALRDWKVIFFRDQDLTIEQHAAFAARWGILTDDTLAATTAARAEDNVVVFVRDAATPGLENEWHSDGTFRPVPTMGTILRAIEVPEVGGDTLFADMGAAYDGLSDATKERIDGLVAEHDWIQTFGLGMDKETREELRKDFPAVQHPVVRTHPETGRKTLYVNRAFTQRIVDLPPEEGKELLEHLYRQAAIPEYQCRYRWHAGDVAFWDNRSTQHYASSDYFPQRRVMERITVIGDRPY